MSNDPTNDSPEAEQAYSPRRAARAARARAEADGWGTHAPDDHAPSDADADANPATSTLRAAEAALLAAATERAAAGVLRQAEAQATLEQDAARRLAAEEQGRREYESLRAEATAAAVKQAATETLAAERSAAAAEAEEQGRREYESRQARAASDQERADVLTRRAEAEERGRREYEELRSRKSAEKLAIAAASAQRAREEVAAAQSEATDRIRQTLATQRQRQFAYAAAESDLSSTTGLDAHEHEHEPMTASSEQSQRPPRTDAPATPTAPSASDAQRVHSASAPASPGEPAPAPQSSSESAQLHVPTVPEHDEADHQEQLDRAAFGDQQIDPQLDQPIGQQGDQVEDWYAQPTHGATDTSGTHDFDDSVHEATPEARNTPRENPEQSDAVAQIWENDEYGHSALDFAHEDAPDAEQDEAERANVFLPVDPSQAAAARKKRRRRRNVIMIGVLGGFIALVLVAVLFLQSVIDKFNPQDFEGPGGAAITFEVKQGWGPLQIGASLQDQNIVASKKLFVEALNLVEAESKTIHPGEYKLREQMPALAAATILVGQGNEKVGYVAIKQNTRIGGVLEEIAKSTDIPLAELEKLSVQPKAFGLPASLKNLEGFLHPGEYRFPLDANAKTVLKLMVDATLKELKDQGITDVDEQYRVLKIASILQAEARPDDYAIVAGALENRLHASNKETNGLLQVDSTVIYGLDRYTLQMTGDEKKDASNLFNSYVHKGLPPTPIGSPADSAIEAAVNPTPNDYYYWVTVNTNTGETKFAQTYAEHLVNQNEFRSWCAANTDVCK